MFSRRKKGEPEAVAEEMAKKNFSYEEYMDIGRQVWTTRMAMRYWPHNLFCQLSLALVAIHPLDHKYEVYTMPQLQVLARMLNEEYVRIQEAIIKKAAEENPEGEK